VKKFVFVLTFLMSFIVYADALDEYRCQEKLRKFIHEWKPDGQWEKQYQAGLESYFHASATQTFGEWVLVRDIPKGVVLAKTDQNGRIEIELIEPDCQQREKVYPHDAPVVGFKSDKDIAEFMSKHKSGVIYVWSPRMTLSLRGISEIQKATKELKLALLVLLDKQVRDDELKELRKSLGLELTTRVDSFEFRMRKIGQHYPAMLVFKDSKILPVVKYGFEKSYRYKSDLTLILRPGK
jgi:hypothetical protein